MKLIFYVNDKQEMVELADNSTQEEINSKFSDWFEGNNSWGWMEYCDEG